jgi:hypothetical protein
MTQGTWFARYNLSETKRTLQNCGVGADPCVGPGADTRVRPYKTSSRA